MRKKSLLVTITMLLLAMGITACGKKEKEPQTENATTTSQMQLPSKQKVTPTPEPEETTGMVPGYYRLDYYEDTIWFVAYEDGYGDYYFPELVDFTYDDSTVYFYEGALECSYICDGETVQLLWDEGADVFNRRDEQEFFDWWAVYEDSLMTEEEPEYILEGNWVLAYGEVEGYQWTPDVEGVASSFYFYNEDGVLYGNYYYDNEYMSEEAENIPVTINYEPYWYSENVSGWNGEMQGNSLMAADRAVTERMIIINLTVDTTDRLIADICYSHDGGKTIEGSGGILFYERLESYYDIGEGADVDIYAITGGYDLDELVVGDEVLDANYEGIFGNIYVYADEDMEQLLLDFYYYGSGEGAYIYAEDIPMVTVAETEVNGLSVKWWAYAYPSIIMSNIEEYGNEDSYYDEYLELYVLEDGRLAITEYYYDEENYTYKESMTYYYRWVNP